MATGAPCEGERKGVINSELWHACAGPLVTLPSVGSLVVYFPQGHSEQVATSMQKNVDAQIPNYPNLPSKLICMLHNVTLHADSETDEVYAQMTLQPINVSNKEALFASDPALNQNRPHTEFFCKTLTASDTSTHGGFSVPRRAAEKIFPPLDFSMQPPVQELQARDLHGNMWTFRHIYRGQPKRHLLTTGWSLFVSGKRLVAGDSVLFIRDEKSQLLLGIRRANKQPNNISSSVLSSDSMHIGILAAAAHAAANNSPFTVFYNPRASPSEFVIPLAKYNKAIYGNHVSLGMRFRMMFETEESGTRRYMGTITGISDLDPVRWKDSKWRNIQVGWDESAAGERRNRVSVWEIEPVIAPFFICPPPFLGSKLPRQFGGDSSDMENIFKRFRPWVGEESQSHMPGLSLAQWMNIQQNHLLVNSNAQQNNLVAASNMRPDYICSLTGHALQNLGATNLTNQSGLQQQVLQQNNVQINAQNPIQKMQQLNQMPKLSVPLNQFGTTQQQPSDSMQQKQNLINQSYPSSQTNNFLQPQVPMSTQFQQQHLVQNIQPPQAILPLNPLKQFPVQQQHLQQEQNQMPIHMYRQTNYPTQILDQEIQIQLLQKLQQQQNSSMPQLPASQAIQQQQNLLKASQSFTQTLSQQNIRSQQISRITSIEDHLSQSLQHQAQQKCQQKQVTEATLPGVILQATSLLSPNRNCVPITGVAKEETTNDDPPCSVSLPIIYNGAICSQAIKDSTFPGPIAPNEIPHSAVTTLSSSIPEVPSIAPDINKDLYIKDNKVKHQVYLGSLPQVDFLDSSSSATSDSLLQADGQLQQSLPLSSFKQQTLFPRSSIPESNTQGSDPVHDDLLCINIDGAGTFDIPSRSACLTAKEINPGNDFLNHLSSCNMLANSSPKEAQQDISSCYVSRSFGVPDVAFSSVHPTTSDSNYLNRSSRTPASQPQKIRTYTKVYKRGAVGRSIDVTRYSGYTELKQDLARMFSIGGQLEDLQRMGWKLVYVDQENDVLLVGDDPWEEFVSCVRCIRILSPQEVQQMSLDGDIDNSILPNPACSSSDGGNVWSEEGYQNPMNPSTLSYGHFG